MGTAGEIAQAAITLANLEHELARVIASLEGLCLEAVR
jgi:hypothetical protein